MAAPLAPDVAIRAIPQGKPRDTVQLTLEISGGTYSRLEYEWYEDLNNDLFVLGNLFSASRNVRNPIWTRPLVHHDGFINVGCRVRAYGTGAQSNDHVENVATENAYVLYVPSVIAPSVEIQYIPPGKERTFVTLLANVGAQRPARADVLTYLWECFTGDNYEINSTAATIANPSHHSPRFERPDVDFTRDVAVRLTITAEGRNIDAVKKLPGDPPITSRIVRLCHIDDIPEADCPQLIRIEHNDVDPDIEGDWLHSAGSGETRDIVWLRVHYNDQTGHYDYLEFAWHWKFHSDSEWILIDQDSQTIKWKRPETLTRQQYDIRCTVTAFGSDINAAINSTDSDIIVSAETALFINPLPSATAANSARIQRIQDGGSDWGPFGIPDGIEGSSLGLRVLPDLNGTHYDTVTYLWTVHDHDGNDITATALTYADRDVTHLTRPQVSGGNRQITVKGTCLTHGDGTNYLQGSVAERSQTITTTVINHPLADCPNVYRSIIGDQHGFLSGQPVQYHCIVGDRHAGLYDRLTFRWQFSFDLNFATERTDVWDDRFAQNPILTRPSVNVPTTCYIAVTVTAHGDGVLADEGSTDSDNFADAEIVNPLPVADHPTLTIVPIRTGPAHSKVQLEASVTGGTYDTLTYEWEYSDDNGGSWRSVLGDTRIVHWTRPDVAVDTNFMVRARVDANGTGSVAREATHDQGPWVSATLTVTPRQVTPPTHFIVQDHTATNRPIIDVAIVDPVGNLREIPRLVIADGTPTAREIFNSGN